LVSLDVLDRYAITIYNVDNVLESRNTGTKHRSPESLVTFIWSSSPRTE
jgi:hypothetical protein